MEAYSRRGVQLVAARRYAEAEDTYQRGLDLDPSSGRLRYNLGKLQYRLGRQDEALRTLAQAARLGMQQGDWDLVGETARIFANLGLADEARTLLDQCLALQPGNPQLSPCTRRI